MPLSEEELRLLEQMERALVAEDPKFASTLRGTAFRRDARRRMFIASGVFVVGVAVLMTGAVTRQTVVGIVGFVVMLVSAYVALTSWNARNSTPAPATTAQDSRDGAFGLSVINGGKAKKRTGRTNRPHRPNKMGRNHSMMERFEDRWRRRREQNGGF